jgi:drug/metabolite transporter (DMT)-like permease
MQPASLQKNSIKKPANTNKLSSLSKLPVKQDPWRGVFWKVISCLCFAMLNTCVRYLTGGAGQVSQPLTPSQLTFLQNVVGCALLLPWIARYGFHSLKTDKPILHGVRVISGVSGIILLYYAFKTMPVAQAVSLQFTGPIFTAIGAWFYLREYIGPLRLLGILLGLTGAFIITRPDQAFMGTAEFSLGWAALFPIGSAIAFAVAKLVGRDLALKGESALLLTTYLVFFMVPASLLPALYEWAWPTAEQWIYIGVLGFFAWAAHFSMAKSYGYADVVFLTPFGFSRILFSALLAYIAFGELPKSSGFWIGTAVIMVSAVLITLEEERLKKA